MLTPGANRSEELNALFNNAAIGILTVDQQGVIMLANDFATKQFGYRLDELIGNKIEILIPQRFHQQHVHHRDGFINKKTHSRPMGVGMNLSGIRKDGSEFPVEVSISSYETAKGKFAIAFINDITVRKESEDALIELNSKLEQKVKERTSSLSEALEKEKELNELKSRFVSMASHEFRTPLSTILSSAYLIAQYIKTEDQSKRDKHIARIVSSVNMLNDILNDFLSVGRIEEGKIQVRIAEVNFKEVITAVVNEMQTILKPGQEILYTHSGDEVAWLEPSLLRHIMMNLISNAIKFSPENSHITIQTMQENGKLALTVQDSGLGISEEDQTHLFDRFFRGSNVSNIQGTGLGLHIVSKYVELMNGTIVCNSELNKGTTFIINLDLNKNNNENNTAD
ncbi:MAG: PAS domain-containing sensor histidine kinase [Chitinophagaceae bacterium]|nr:PAS domain-containing sensor histidine kinase [Chitinophagaceae bacterium]MCB9046467.1 PAS domain-containing sensor histidine kinase [Chitinophagales bacterium]